MYRLILLCAMGILTAQLLQAQDPMFSQFYASPLQINPAFAGVTIAPRLTLNYRNQWGQIEGGYETYAATYEQSLADLNSGIGLILMADDAMDGVYKTNRVSGVYGYELKINRNSFIKFGIEAGLIRTSVDWDRLRFGDQIDPLNGFEDPQGNPTQSAELRPQNLNKTIFDVGAGVLVFTEKYYGGVSVKHLNNPDESLLEINDNLGAGLPLRFIAHGGAEFEVGTGNNQTGPAFISPNVMIVRQGDFGQVNAGAYAGFGKFFAGGWYRMGFSNADAAILLVGYNEGILRIGYSYDFTVSNLAAVNPGGTHEISVMINFDNSKETQRRRRSSRYNDCFRMFR